PPSPVWPCWFPRWAPPCGGGPHHHRPGGCDDRVDPADILQHHLNHHHRHQQLKELRSAHPFSAGDLPERQGEGRLLRRDVQCLRVRHRGRGAVPPYHSRLP